MGCMSGHRRPKPTATSLITLMRPPLLLLEGGEKYERWRRSRIPATGAGEPVDIRQESPPARCNRDRLLSACHSASDVGASPASARATIPTPLTPCVFQTPPRIQYSKFRGLLRMQKIVSGHLLTFSHLGDAGRARSGCGGVATPSAEPRSRLAAVRAIIFPSQRSHCSFAVITRSSAAVTGS
jgi:hypothetical protein